MRILVWHYSVDRPDAPPQRGHGNQEYEVVRVTKDKISALPIGAQGTPIESRRVVFDRKTGLAKLKQLGPKSYFGHGIDRSSLADFESKQKA